MPKLSIILAILFVALLILVFVTVSINGYSLYLLLSHLPGIGAIRAVTRVVLVMLFPVGVLVAIGSERLILTLGQSPYKRYVVYALVVVLVGLEAVTYQPYNTPIDRWYERQSALRKLLPKSLPNDVIINVSIQSSEPYYLIQLDSMILAQDLGVPTLNGYSGYAPPGQVTMSPCHPDRRLRDYAFFRKIPDDTLDKLSDRVVHLKVSDCNQVTAVQAKLINVSASDFQVVNGQLIVNITVTTNSKSVFDASSARGFPIRLSWRFVPISLAGHRLSEPDWGTRQDLGWSIPPGGSLQTTISAELPQKAENYMFEVSLVLELVAWLHDLGMEVSRTAIPGDALSS